MKKPLILILSLVATSAIFSVLWLKNNKTESETLIENLPGFGAQWRIMKQNAQGEIPTGLYSRWYAADKMNTEAAYKKRFYSAIASTKFVGPNLVGGRTRDILIDSENDEHLFACAISGGIWESTNAGKQWTAKNDQSTNLNVTCIDQSPLNPKLIYYGTGESASNSSGAPGEGVFKSVDGGKTFLQLMASVNISNMNEIWDIKCSSTDTNTFYVACAKGGVWRSTDGGKSFENVFSGPNSINNDVHEIEIFPDGGVMLAVESEGVYYSQTGELGTFDEQSKGLPVTGFNRISLTYCKDYPNVVYAQLSKGLSGYDGSSVGVWKSSNRGKSWKAVSNPAQYGGDYRFPWYTLVLEVSPKDSNFLVTGSIKLHYSTNGGQSWKSAKQGHADNHSVVFNHQDSTQFFVGSDGGIHEFDIATLGNTNQNRNNGYFVTQFYGGGFGAGDYTLITGAQDNGTHYQNNDAFDFDYVQNADGGWAHIHQQNTSIAYASKQNGYITKSTNIDGIRPNFSLITSSFYNSNGSYTEPIWFIAPYEMNYLDGDQLFLSTKRKVWASYDGGDSWRALHNNRSNPYATGIPNELDPSKVYVGGENLLLLRIDNPKTSNPGDEINIRKNFPPTISRGFIGNIQVHPDNASTIFICLTDYTDEPRIWRVEEADTDEPVWIDISGNLPLGLPCNSVAIHPKFPNDAFVVATDFGLYSTTNGGQTWIKETSIPNVAIHQIRLRKSDLRLFIFTHGRGAFTADLEEFPNVSREQIAIKSLSIYPNPCANYVRVNAPELIGKTFNIIDINGKMVLNGKLNATQIALHSLESGSYFLKVSGAEKTYQAQFVKQ